MTNVIIERQKELSGMKYRVVYCGDTVTLVVRRTHLHLSALGYKKAKDVASYINSKLDNGDVIAGAEISGSIPWLYRLTRRNRC